MRLHLALVLTIFISLGVVVSTNVVPQLLQLHALRAQGSTSLPTNSSVSSTPSSSTSTSTSLASSTTLSTSSSTTSTFTISSSSQSLSSSFSTSSSSTINTEQFSSSQEQSSSTQSTQFQSSVNSLSTGDTISTSISSPTAFTSTASDGSLTVTAVVSTPSGGSGLGSVNTAKQGFFVNTGAVAGTFLVVGLVGTGILICAFLWALRRYRRRRNDQVYFDNEYTEFNDHVDRGATPEATLPVAGVGTPVPPSPVPDMIERLHGNEAALFNIYHDPAQYQAHPDEFDPYQSHRGSAYTYTDDPGNSQHRHIPFAYQPEVESNSTKDFQAAAGLLHPPQGSVNSLHPVN